MYYHVDRLAALVAPAAVTAVPDGGYFYASDPSFTAWRATLLWIAGAMNSRGGLNAACVDGVARAGGDPLTCAFPEVVSPHLSTRTFVMNSRFDPALDAIAAGESGGNAAHVNEIGARVLGLSNTTLLLGGRGNGAFITSCHEHCGQWAQGVDGDFNVTIDGASAVPALMEWRRGGQRSLWVQPAAYPCNDCCSGGN